MQLFIEKADHVWAFLDLLTHVIGLHGWQWILLIYTIVEHHKSTIANPFHNFVVSFYSSSLAYFSNLVAHQYNKSYFNRLNIVAIRRSFMIINSRLASKSQQLLDNPSLVVFRFWLFH
jgi:hypothetical protein